MNCVKVSSQSYLAGLYHKIFKNLFLLYIVDEMIIQQRFNVLLQVPFYNIFTNVLSKVFTDILKNYELPKIYNKKPKYCQTLVSTIIIYQKRLFLLHQMLSLISTTNLVYVLDISIFGRYYLQYISKVYCGE